MRYITRNWMAFSTALALLAIILSMTMALSVPTAQSRAAELNGLTAQGPSEPPTPILRKVSRQPAPLPRHKPDARIGTLAIPEPMHKPHNINGSQIQKISGLYDFLYMKLEAGEPVSTSPLQLNLFVCMKRDTAPLLPGCHMAPGGVDRGPATG